MPKIDLSIVDNADGENIEPVPPGVYNAAVESADHKNDGKEHIAAVFTITDGEFSGRKVREWFYLHMDTTRRISLEKLGNLGIPDNFNPKNASQLIGKKCKINTVLSDDGKFANVKTLYQRDITSGQYEAIVENLENDTIRDHEVLKVTYKITSPGEFNNFRVSDRLYFHDKAIKFTAVRLKRLGADVNEFDTSNLSHLRSIKNTKVRLSIMPWTSTDGRTFNRISDVKKLEDVTEMSVQIPASEVAGVEDFEAGFDDDRF